MSKLSQEKIKFYISSELSKVRGFIVLASVFVIAGLIVGIFLAFGDYVSYKILSTSGEKFFEYISGGAKLGELFFSRLIIMLLSATIIFVTMLNYYAGFIGLIYLSYQSSVFVLSLAASIKYFGAISVLSIIVNILSNLLIIIIQILLASFCMHRANNVRKNRATFKNSFNQNYWQNMLLILSAYFIVEFFASIIVPLFFRTTTMIIY